MSQATAGRSVGITRPTATQLAIAAAMAAVLATAMFLAAGSDSPPLVEDQRISQTAQDAWAARYTGLAVHHGAVLSPADGAWAARYQGFADRYTSLDRARAAEAARWQATADSYASPHRAWAERWQRYADSYDR